MKRRLISILMLLVTCLLLHATPQTGESWLRVDGGFTDQFTSVEWNGPLAVAVGSRGMICTSSDGKIWTSRRASISVNLNTVIWNGSLYIAVGEGGTVIRSNDGIGWQRVIIDLSESLVGVTWNGTMFVALGNNASIFTSIDGIIWGLSGSAKTNGISLGTTLRIYHFDGVYYLLSSSQILRSLDLVTWTSVASGSVYLTANLKKLNGRLFAIHSNRSSTLIRYSDDGITWHNANVIAPTLSNSDVYDITFHEGVFVAVGSSFKLVSYDGQNWIYVRSPNAALYSVVWKNGEFIAVGYNRTISTSKNGFEWTSRAKDTYTSSIDSIVWSGSLYIGVGRNGLIMTSPDFEEWTTRNSQSIANFNSVVWTGSFAIASVEGGGVLKSVDGILWNPVTTVAPLYSRQLLWTGSTIFSFGASGTFQSTNGDDWEHIATNVLGFNHVTWTGEYFVRVDQSGSIDTSPTGVVWTRTASVTTSPLYAVKSQGGIIMAGGQNSTLLRSNDGTTWTSLTAPAAIIYSIDYQFGKWFLSTSSGIFSSVDGTTWQQFAELGSITASELVWDGTKLNATGINASTSDGQTWTRRPLPQFPSYRAVDKSSSGWVAVGQRGAIAFSSDGYVWNDATSVTLFTLNDVSRSLDGWVAVGDVGVILRSTDGLIWNMVSSGTTQSLTEVEWNGSMFAAVGAGGIILVSNDGMTWSRKDIESTGNITNLTVTGTEFHAYIGFGDTVSSVDGNFWSKYNTPEMADVLWVGTHYIAVSSNGWIYQSSSDGKQWSRVSIGKDSYLSGICWSGNLIVAVGSGGTIVTSPDGISWTHRAIGTTEFMQSVVWNGTQFVVVGRAGLIFTSADGVTWTPRNSGTTVPFQKILWENGVYTAVAFSSAGVAPTGFRSTDGITWSLISGTLKGGFSLGWIGDQYLSGGRGSRDLSTVTNSGDWQSPPSNLETSIFGLEWDGSRIFAVGNAGVSILSNSSGTWTSNNVHSSPFMDSIEWNGSQYVAVGFDETIAISSDGNNWENVSGGKSVALTAVASNGSRFVGVLGNEAYISTNGRTWNKVRAFPATTNPIRSFRDIIWTGSKFLAVGDHGVIASSSDGYEWDSHGNYSFNPTGLSAVAGDDSLVVAVGSDGYIAVSEGTTSRVKDFSLWITDQGASNDAQGEADDPNGDGISNITAYIHGIPAVGEVRASNRSALPFMRLDPISGAAVFHFELHGSYRANATYFIEASDNLASESWETIHVREKGVWKSHSINAAMIESTLPSGGVGVEIHEHPSSSSSGKRFFRVRTAFSK